MSEVAGPVPVVGPRAVEALLRHSPQRIRRLLYQEPLQGARARVVAAARVGGLQVVAERPEALARLAGELRHQGLIALAEPADYAEWEELVAHPAALLLAVDQVTDPHNLGAMLRAVEALGGTGALVTRDRCARLGPTVTRTSAGASEILPVALETNLARALHAARGAGLQVVGADLDGVSPARIDWARPTVLVIGAEGAGLRRLTRDACDHLVTIPLRGHTESLNAATATAVLFYEAMRHRPAAPPENIA